MADRIRRQDHPDTEPARPRRAFYGRRLGRALRPGTRAVLEDVLPRVAIELPPPGGTLDLAALFGGARPVWIEIGFGAGEHLAWQAERNPGVGLIGAEYFLHGVARLTRRIGDAGLDHVRVYRGDARDLLDALPEASLDRVFILFPDPWPKARHHKRRIVCDEVLDRLAVLMKDGVDLRLATDDMPYARWMLERLVRHPSFEWLARGPRDWRERTADWPPTRYEAKAAAQGRKAVYLRFRRRPRQA
jgi:tRNA (guanine-N7-)-methyltransferase